MEAISKVNQWINPWAKRPQEIPLTTKFRDIAINTFAIGVAGLGIAASLYVGGCALTQLGLELKNVVINNTFLATQLKFTSQTLLSAGQWICWAGETLFLSVAVPAYGLVYAGPRWVINNVVPALCQHLATAAEWINREVITVLANYTAFLIKKLPVEIGAALHKVWCHAMDAIYYLMTHLIIPALKTPIEIAKAALKELSRFMAKAIEWTVINVGVPTAEFVLKTLESSVAGLIQIAQKIKPIWIQVTGYVSAMSSSVGHAALTAVEWINSNIMSKVAQVAESAMQYLSAGMNRVHENAIVPVWNRLNDVCVAVIEKISAVFEAIQAKFA